MKKSLIALGTGLLVSFASPSFALNLEGLNPEEAGLAIAKAADERETGFVSTTSEMTMTLINRRGDKSIRNLRSKVLEVHGDGDKSMSIFDEPADVKGTAMLTHSHGLEPDDQWLYLPALKRVKRISSKNKSGPFMGSEFAYEDLSSQEVEKYSYKLLGEEEIDGQNTYILERIPQYEHSGYTKQIAWIDTEHLRTVKVDYYDRKGSLLKTLTFSDYQQYKDKFWRASTMFMQNHQTKKATELKWGNFVFGSPEVKESDFVSNALKRVR